MTTLLDQHGKPIVPKASKASMLAGGAGRFGGHPYDAADTYGAHVAEWNPYLGSVDGDLNPVRDRIVARARDLARNDGWAAGAVTRFLDNVVGANFRPISKPDYRALAAYSGLKAFDATWADEYGQAVEAAWRTWANDVGKYCDTQRSLTIAQIFCLAYRHKLIDGDALAMVHFLPERMKIGAARYATAIQVIDPDRLSNPQNRFDDEFNRGGVVIDGYGAATAYNIRQAHQGDWWAAQKSLTWVEIAREHDFGRPIIVHDFNHHRADTHRGGAGILTPVMNRLKMLAKYDSTELDAAIVNAIFGAYVESPYDPQLVQEALGEGETLGAYQDARSGFHEKRRIALNGVVMPQMFPGEKINTVHAERPSGNFEAFEGAVLRNFSAGTGLSAQQVSNNWSDVNYSSARGALLEAWKTLARERSDFAVGFASPIYGAALEEFDDLGDLPLPAGAPEFVECRTEYSACVWMGPGRGWIDPVAEKQGAVLGMDAGLSTLEQECAEQGLDWEVILDQRAREVKAFKDRGLVPPTWSGVQPAAPNATRVSQKPEPV